MLVKTEEIKIEKRVRKDLGDLKGLMESITEIGLLHPIVCYRDMKSNTIKLLAGRRRLEAHKKLGKTEIKVNLVTMDDVLKAELHENTIRKAFTFSEMCEIDDVMSPKIKEDAEKRMKAGKPLPKLGKGRSGDKMGDYFGMSHGTYDKFRKIKGATKTKKFSDIADRIDDGMSIDYAYKMVTTTEKAETPTPNLPKGVFELIYLDLPWHYDLQLTGAPPYKTMRLEEMKEEIKPPTAKDCIMFMWVTNPKLEEGLELLKYWGFTYKTKMAWIKWKNEKLQVGTGYYVKGADEMLLIAIKGSPGVPPESARPPSVVFAERTKKHSEKPKIFYEIIEKMYPARKKLEMFARNKRDGWTSWGDQVEYA